MSLTTLDLFTDEEYRCYEEIVGCINKLNSLDKHGDPSERLNLVAQKKAAQDRLSDMIAKARGSPRLVSTRRVTDTRRLKRDEEGRVIPPEGVSWKTLRVSRKISEFASEESRALGLRDKEVTFDKIIVKWKSLDVLESIVLDGFQMDVIQPDGTVKRVDYQFMTASAGQLRTDKIQCISREAWQRIAPRMMGGLTMERINELGGINPNKFQAYLALGSGATEEFDFPPEKMIVIDDFEGPVEGTVDFISKDYEMSRRLMETVIKHTDGCGMMLPSVSRKNFMLRGPWIKGLLASFDYLRFCRVNGCEPKLADIWGREHDLVAEDIRIVLTKSQFKLYAYYDSWEEYCRLFRESGCHLCRTNYEEDYIPDTTISYQMLQTLTDMTDEEIDVFTKRTHERIEGLTKDSRSMLRALGADVESPNPYRRALAAYPEMLRESYTRETLKNIKARWILDAKSGRIRCRNKRLFAIPDLYAACQYWFLGQERPEGLLKDGEVAAYLMRDLDKVACLRSPHLYMEWTIRNVVHDPEIYEWFYTDGIYTSCHDLISKVLQFDVDGDQLNVVYEPVLIEAAERELEKHGIVPLLYDLGKAPAKPIDNNAMFDGLKRAHEYSGIGQVSNSLTKLWNRPDPDRFVAACLTYMNNLVIDAAKTGYLNSFENYPELNKRVTKATGGKNGRMPWFFQFSKNGRHDLHLPVSERKKVAKTNGSTMNRISAKFDDIGNISMYKADVPPFNWQMLLVKDDVPYDRDAVRVFCELDDGNRQNLASASATKLDANDVEDSQGYEFVRDLIVEALEPYGGLEVCYPSVVKYLFAAEDGGKATHKQMFWRVFGEIAEQALFENSLTYSVCDKCGMKIPGWSRNHVCPKDASGFFECATCGAWTKRTNSRQYRCPACQEAHVRQASKLRKRISYVPKKGRPECTSSDS